VDLRVLVSFPKLLEQIAQVMFESLANCKFDCVCGVPYTALPIATVLSIKNDVPMVMRRKEAKAYGTKKEIEGVWKEGMTCLVVEDLVTSGLSVFETIDPLNRAGLKVEDVVVLLDREQGGRENIHARDVRLHAVFTISDILEELVKDGLVGQEKMNQIKLFIQENQVKIEASGNVETSADVQAKKHMKMDFAERSKVAKNAVAKKLFHLMNEKKSNLCLSIDLTDKKEILRIIDQVGSFLCMVKTHADVIENFDEAFIRELVALSAKHNFLIFEDRKFADIGNTVSLQYAKGVHKIIEWAHITNAHCVPGDGVIKGLAKYGESYPEARGLLLLAQMSSAGNLMDKEYTSKVWKMSSEGSFVAGFICQDAKLGGSNASLDPSFVYMTPGVQINSKGDGMGQQYRDPEAAIIRDLNDVIIVGRGLYESSDVLKSAELYRDLGWKAFEKRILS
jgi:uridine monophosphate synthetase